MVLLNRMFVRAFPPAQRQTPPKWGKFRIACVA